MSAPPTVRPSRSQSATGASATRTGVAAAAWAGTLCRHSTAGSPAIMRNFGGTRLFLIACGPNGNDIRWTREFLTQNVGGPHARRLRMHFYENCRSRHQIHCRQRWKPRCQHLPPRRNGHPASARAPRRISSHGRIAHDPDAGRVGRVGSHDSRRRKTYGRLWQQITMRSAVAAGLGLNHVQSPGRQAVHVQHRADHERTAFDAAHRRTRGKVTVRTTTYHAFMIFKQHRGNTSVVTRNSDSSQRAVSLSASRSTSQSLLVSLVNPSPTQAVTARCTLSGWTGTRATGSILHSENLNAFNSFEQPDQLHPVAFSPRMESGKLIAELPPLSMATIKIEA